MEVVLQDEQLVEVAFLGPKGTYGYQVSSACWLIPCVSCPRAHGGLDRVAKLNAQAAKQLIARLDATCSASSSPTSATPQATAPEAAHRYQYTPCPTIPDIYTCPAEYLVMPLQNTLHGGVLETLDSLLSPLTPAAQGKLRSRSKGGSDTGNGDPGKDGEETRGLGMPMIVDSLDLGIRHCLVVKRGTRMEDIRWVRSHEQVSGTSSIGPITLISSHRWGMAITLCMPLGCSSTSEAQPNIDAPCSLSPRADHRTWAETVQLTSTGIRPIIRLSLATPPPRHTANLALDGRRSCFSARGYSR